MSANQELCSLRWNAERQVVEVIDQTLLPHSLQWCELESLASYCHAISAMQVRGAPLIGITAAFGLAGAMARDPSDENLSRASKALLATRPTAVNLGWALAAVAAAVRDIEPGARARVALAKARQLRAEDIANCSRIGEHGLALLRGLKPDGPLNIMTHCNAGWLATVDYGTATSPIYIAMEEGIPVHVYVDETRPRNQGAFLTSWELASHGAPHTLIVDNAGGHLMQRGQVDMVIVGTDRTTANGDVCNKIGTYLKALAAHDNGVPFYVALPSPTIDWSVRDGLAEIPIEERSADEVSFVQGRAPDGSVTQVRISPDETPAANPAFDVTPARLVAGLITERGICKASPEGLRALFPDRVDDAA